jgi:hypothetical protein
MGTVPSSARAVIAGSAHMRSMPPELSTLLLAAMRRARLTSAVLSRVVTTFQRYSRRVPDYHLVKVVNGPGFDPSRARRDQDRWAEHAAFMDALVDEGVVVLGGPVGDVDSEDILLVVDVEDEAEIRGRLAADPWADDILRIESVRPWSVWLRPASG